MSLKDSAILVRTKFSQFSNYVKSKEATALVEQTYHTKHGAGNFNKHLLKNSEIRRAYSNLIAGAYSWHIQNTSPWYDDGYRILNSLNALEYAEKMEGFRQGLAALAGQFQSEYDKEVAADIARLGNLGNAADYPSFSDFSANYGIESVFLPVPDTEDFRCSIPDRELLELRQMVHGAEALVRDDILSKILNAFRPLVENYSKEEGRVYDSHKDALVDLQTVISNLNIYNDVHVQSFLTKLEDFISNFSVTEARTFVDRKQALSERALELCNDLKGMF
jgi:hypothetical protein